MNMTIAHPNECNHLKDELDDVTFKKVLKAFEDDLPSKCGDEINTADSEDDSSKSNRGRKPNTVKNPLQQVFLQYGSFINLPRTVMDIIEGVSRLDWYNRGDELREGVVTEHPDIKGKYPCVTPWKRVLYKCDANSKLCVREAFLEDKPTLYGDVGLFSPAGETRKQYLHTLNTMKNDVSGLSVVKVFIIIKSFEEVTTKGICDLFGFAKRQGQRYMKAVQIMMPYLEGTLERFYKQTVEFKTKKFIKEQERLNLPYTLEDIEYYLQGYFDTLAVDSVGGGLSDAYHEGITGVYVPFTGVVLNACKINCANDTITENDVDALIEREINRGH